MFWTGKKVCNDREIIWDSMHSRFKLYDGCLSFGVVIFCAWAVYGMSLVFQGTQYLEARNLLLAVGLMLIVGGVCGLLWQDYLAFDLPRRRYFQRRGFGRWARDVVSGDFADFSHIQIDGSNESSESEGGISYVVSLIWAETVSRRGRRRFKLGGAARADQAAALAAELAVPLKIPIEEKWLRGEKPTPAR